MLLDAKCHSDVLPILFGGNLTALEKKTEGIWPIAVGYTWHRITAKCANTFTLILLQDYFVSLQLGVGTNGGSNAAIHSAPRFIECMPENFVIVNLDFANAFNSLHRDVMLDAVFNTVPEIYKLCHLCYSNMSILRYGSRLILSQEGTQQGNPLGPLLFA